MPVYEYKCSNCGRFELEQSIKEEPLTHCPSCGNTCQRLISKNVGIIFKGPGFYINDSRPESAKDSQKSSSSAS